LAKPVAFIEEEARKLRLRFSEGWRNLGRATNKVIAWPKFCERLGTPTIDTLTSEQYHKLSQKDRHERKNQGWFVGGTFKDGIRRQSNIEGRSMLCYDIDECSPELFASLTADVATGYLAEKEHFVYTTRSHTPETPRVRVVVPLSREITTGEFGPICRIVAFKIDESMQQIDPVSFRITQLMFLPSRSKDGEFITNWRHGALLNPDDVLKDWARDYSRDYSRLPRSPREAGKLREHGIKVGDPRKKRGIIGAWCRAHSITELLAEQWADLYEPGDATVDGTLRYTYKPGSTTNGVLIYDDLHAYSHHSSDPISNILVNAWDMERILRFGHLDKFCEQDEWDHDPRKLPSYKAMLEWAQDDTDTKWELQQADYDAEAAADDMAVEADPEEVAAADAEPVLAPDRTWERQLETTGDGIVKSTLHNIVTILENAVHFKGAFAHNAFLERNVLRQQIASRRLGRSTRPIRDKLSGDPLRDVDIATARAILEAPHGPGKVGWGLRVSAHNMHEAVDVVSERNQFHPVREFMQACRWDGVPRLRKLLATYWHTPDDEYHAQVGYLFALAAVTRVHEPGHKFDFVPIFEGREDLLKSTAIMVLAGQDWYGEFTEHDMRGTREIVEKLSGKLLVEMSELTAMLDDRRSAETMKAMLSSSTDRARLAYRRNEAEFRRQGILLGTTNQKEYMRGHTGNRRLWPVEVPERIDVEGVRRDRELLWAEALAEYQWWRRQPAHLDLRVPLPLFLTGEAAATALRLQGTKMQASEHGSRQGIIAAWLDQPVPQSQSKPGWRPDGSEDPPVDEPRVLRQRVCLHDVRYFALDEHEGRRATSRDLSLVMSHVEGWAKNTVAHRCGKFGAQTTWSRIGSSESDDTGADAEPL
jgi:putative DNA primase/helicase